MWELVKMILFVASFMVVAYLFIVGYGVYFDGPDCPKERERFDQPYSVTFAEHPSFDAMDMCRLDPNCKGIIVEGSMSWTQISKEESHEDI